MKKIKRIKWENLTTLAMIIFAVERALVQVATNGVSNDTSIEIAMYGLAVMGARYLVKDLRLNPINWLLDK